MSQLTHPTIARPKHGRARRAVLLGALLSATAVAVVVLILALAAGTSSQDAVPASMQAQPGVRADGGPDEGTVAAAIGSRNVSRPGATAGARPDESAVAAAIARR